MGEYLISASEESFGANRNMYLIKTDSAGTSNYNEGHYNNCKFHFHVRSGTATNVSSGGSTITANSLKEAALQ